MSPEFHFLKSSFIDQVLNDVFFGPLSKSDFEKVRPRRWVRNRVRLIRDVIEFRGDPYHMNIIWGLSLDFVPRITGATIGWHRTNKSAAIDLVYSPKDGEADRRTRIWNMRGLDGEEAFRADARRMLRWAVPKALSFFDSVLGVQDLLPLFEQRMKRPVAGIPYMNLGLTPLAHAFTLAKSNHEIRARAIFDQFMSRYAAHYREETVFEYRRLFEKAMEEPYYLA